MNAWSALSIGIADYMLKVDSQSAFPDGIFLIPAKPSWPGVSATRADKKEGYGGNYGQLSAQQGFGMD